MKSEGRKYEKALEFIVLIAVLAFVSVGCASAAAIYVPDDYAKIQWAVDNASAGDTIIVRDGIYIENVDVNKGHLTIKSENGSEAAIVQAANSSDPVFEVTADYVNISGFTVKGATKTTKAGISLGIDVDHCNISNNDVNSNILWGIYLDYSYNNVITNNNCSNNRYGIFLYFSNNNKLTGNIMLEDGIFIVGSQSDYVHEIDTSNTVNGKPVYYWKNVNGGRIPDGAGQVILVNCSNVLVEKQNLNNASVGIQAAFSSYITLKNNNCSSNEDFGIHLKDSNNNVITNNNCLNNGNGIWLIGGSNNNVTNNNCSYNKDGILLAFSYTNKLTGNNMVESGILIEGKSLSHFVQEIDTSNMVNGKPVYYWKDENGGRVPDDAGQVILVNCKNIIVENQNISDTSVGIEVAFSTYITIKNNKCSPSNTEGIYLLDSNENSIMNNNCSNNCHGIHLTDSNENSITNNNCSNDGYSIYLRYSNKNSIKNNNCSNNMYGIRLQRSNNNVIYLNNFMENNDNVRSSDSTNFWNSQKEITYTYNGSEFENYLGNYWDDYTGSDADSDGIGDIPYDIDSDNDSYPLMEPWEIYFPTKSTVSISTDKYEYSTAETMNVNITLINPTGEWQPVYFAWRLDLPDYDLQYRIMTKALYLPLDYEQTFTIPFTVGDYRIPFNASWFVAFYNTTTLEVISEDTADWRYEPAKERARDGDEVMPEVEEIAREISKTVEKIKFPT